MSSSSLPTFFTDSFFFLSSLLARVAIKAGFPYKSLGECCEEIDPAKIVNASCYLQGCPARSWSPLSSSFPPSGCLNARHTKWYKARTLKHVSSSHDFTCLILLLCLFLLVLHLQRSFYMHWCLLAVSLTLLQLFDSFNVSLEFAFLQSSGCKFFKKWGGKG